MTGYRVAGLVSRSQISIAAAELAATTTMPAAAVAMSRTVMFL